MYVYLIRSLAVNEDDLVVLTMQLYRQMFIPVRYDFIFSSVFFLVLYFLVAELNQYNYM